MNVSDLLQKAVEHHVSVVQIGDNYPLHLLSREERQKIAEEASEKGIELEVGTRRLSIPNLKTYLEIGRQLKSRFLRMVIDDADYHPNENEVINTIQEILPELKRAGLMLAIENHDRFPSASLRRIIESTDREWVGICLDTANSLGAGEGINEVAEILAPYTVNLHIKDFMIRRVSHKMGFEVKGCPTGKGMLDIPALVRQLKGNKRCRTATLEVWSNPASDMDSTIQNEAQWVKESLGYLKKILTE